MRTLSATGRSASEAGREEGREKGREEEMGAGGGAGLRQSAAPAGEVASGLHVNQRARSQWEGAEGAAGAGPGRVPPRAGAAK